MNLCEKMYTQTCIRKNKYEHTCTYIHIYAYIHIHTHMYIYLLTSALKIYVLSCAYMHWVDDASKERERASMWKKERENSILHHPKFSSWISNSLNSRCTRAQDVRMCSICSLRTARVLNLKRVYHLLQQDATPGVLSYVTWRNCMRHDTFKHPHVT